MPSRKRAQPQLQPPRTKEPQTYNHKELDLANNLNELGSESFPVDSSTLPLLDPEQRKKPRPFRLAIIV